MATPAKTSVIFGVAAWVVLGIAVAIVEWFRRGHGEETDLLGFLPVLILGFVVIICLIVNLGLGFRAWKEAPRPKPILGLAIGVPLATLLFVAMEYLDTLE